MKVHFEIEVAAPFRLDLTVWALRRRPTNAVDRWDGHTYPKAFRVGDTLADAAVVAAGEPAAPRLSVSVIAAPSADPDEVRAETTRRLEHLLGLETDLADFYCRAADDDDLAQLAHRFHGLKPPRFLELFEGLANAVACQQLSINVGIELLNRLSANFGPEVPSSAMPVHAFPAACDLEGVDPDALGALGFSHQKSLALVQLADRITRGGLRVADLARLDNEEATAALRKLRGVGRWSAEYVLLRGLGRLDVFPGDDVGARNNLQRRFGIIAPLTYDDVRRVTSRWAPFSGLVYFHLLLANVDEAGWLDDGFTP